MATRAGLRSNANRTLDSWLKFFDDFLRANPHLNRHDPMLLEKLNIAWLRTTRKSPDEVRKTEK
jgi:hypothetical protein